MVRAFRELGHDAYAYGREYKTGKPITKVPKQAALLLYMEMNDQDEQYVELASLPCHKIYWDFDTEMHPDFTFGFVKQFGFNEVYLANPAFVPHMRGSRYLPYAVDPKLHNRGDCGRDLDAALLGTAFEQRLKFAKQAGFEIISDKFREDYIATLQRLKIHIHQFSSGGKYLLVNRIWETLGCGALLLAEDNPSLTALFKPDKHIVTYDNPSDCADKIKYYLANDESRRRIANSGYELAMKEHTYLHRAKTILENLGVEC